MLAVVDPIYLSPQKDRVTGYANVTTRQLLEHMYSTYGKINPQTLAATDIRFRDNYTSSEPIESLFTRIEHCMDIVDTGKAPYSTEQVLENTYNLIFQTGVYELPCEEWNKKGDTEKKHGKPLRYTFQNLIMS